jgi:predicted kinase
VIEMFVHLGPASPYARVRELAGPAAVLEVLDQRDRDRLGAAMRAESRPAPRSRRTPVLDLCGPVLVVLVGAAGSGKSTWARANFAPTEIVRTDELRARVCDDEADQDATADAGAIAHLIIAARLARGRRTVVDATNTTRLARGALLGLAAANGVDARAVVTTTPLPVCLARNNRRARHVPEAVLRAQHTAAAACVPGLAGEGFAGVELLNLAAPAELTTATQLDTGAAAGGERR